MPPEEMSQPARFLAQPELRLSSLTKAARGRSACRQRFRCLGAGTHIPRRDTRLTGIPRHSFVIPAYNESERLGPTLDRVLAFVRQQMHRAEILVVNDGSTDQTAAVVRNHRERSGGIIRLLENPENRGKGYSVRNGVLNSAGDIVLFTDADLSAPIEEAVKLIDALNRGADIAIDSRWARSELQTRRQSLARQVLGRVFNSLLQVLLSLKFKDTQCGFKAFRRETARALFPLQRIEGWGFDTEILFLAKKSAFRVAEVPVVWGHDSRTRIKPLRDGWRMVAEMLRIRWYSLTGKYGDVRAPSVPASTAASEHGQSEKQPRIASPVSTPLR
jgi:dolichyl-phosphate beta-glucosyltransferase